MYEGGVSRGDFSRGKHFLHSIYKLFPTSVKNNKNSYCISLSFCNQILNFGPNLSSNHCIMRVTKF